MQMTKAANATNFTGKGGGSYSATGEIEYCDIAKALANGWVPADTGNSNVLAATLGSGATHDYAPSGFGSFTKRLELTCNAAGSTLGGLKAQNDDQEIVIVNVGASGTLTLTHQDASSAAQNRFLANADVTVAVGNSAIAKYSATQARWIVCGLT